MRFKVVQGYRRGQPVPDEERMNLPGVTGDVRTAYMQTGGAYARFASCFDGGTKVLPDLYHVEFCGMSPLALVLSGYERIDTERGVYEVRQEWWCEAVR